MLRNILFFLTLNSLLLTLFVPSARAIYDPLSAPNNKVGVHILSPDELGEAAKLVNNNNIEASWGYVTVPIQTTDRDREKWTRFMVKARELQVIPIIRIATNLDGRNWLEPNSNDLTDFANFLNDLPWPVKNRYVIIFNEVNRADEFGGSISPERYTDILNNAIDIFKSRSDQFFILPAGLDNAAPNAKGYIATPLYLSRMYAYNKEIFNKIDGWTSHAYPNPGFRGKPFESGINKINSFKTDLQLLKKFTSKKLPVFITEAGWSNLSVRPSIIGEYYDHAFNNAWADPSIVTVTPFLLRAGTYPFNQFSLLNNDGKPTPAYLSIQKYAKTGSPQYDPLPTPLPVIPEVLPPIATKEITQKVTPLYDKSFLQIIKELITLLIAPLPALTPIKVGALTFFVELANTPQTRMAGLSKHPPLKNSQGMLFTFENTNLHSFWMKDMAFDIDIVWIKDNTVVGISRGYHDDPKTLLYPPVPIDKVLEINPGLGINVGDKITLQE